MPLLGAAEISWPRGARELNIYSLDPPLVRQADVRTLAERLDILTTGTDADWRMNESRIGLRRGPFELVVDRASGGLRLRHRHRFQSDDGSKVEMTDAEARRAAGAMLRKFGLASAELEVAAVTRFRVAAARKDGAEASERAIDVGVVYRRHVDRRRVEGPGAEAMVFLNAAGELTGLDYLVRPIAGTLRPVEGLRSRDSVLAEFERHFAAQVGAGTMTLTEMRLGHFEHGWGVRQRHLQPAYVGFVQLTAADSRFHRRSVHAVPAATNPVSSVLPRGAGPRPTSTPAHRDPDE